MFQDIPEVMLERMSVLEGIDTRDRVDGTPRTQRLRQVPSEAGRFLALMAAAAPPGPMIEIGASGGYSGLWLSLACRLHGRRLTTFEILPKKADLARETFSLTGVKDLIDLVEGDALSLLTGYDGIAFCFLDAEKEDYPAFYDLVVPRMSPGGLLLADNVINHKDILAPFTERALADERLDGVVVPIGNGVLLCRRR